MPEHTSQPSYLYAWGQGDTGTTLAFCSSLLSLCPDLERLVDGANSWKQRGINSLNADCFLASWYLSTTVLTTSLNRPEQTISSTLGTTLYPCLCIPTTVEYVKVACVCTRAEYGFLQDLDSPGRTEDNSVKVALGQMSNSGHLVWTV